MILFNNKRKKEKEEKERIDRVLKLEQEKEKRDQEELERIERIIQEQKEKLEEQKKKIELPKEQERLKKEEEQKSLLEEERKKIQEEKERLQKEEKERIIKKKKLVSEIIDNYISISNGVTNIKDEFYEEYDIKKFISENLLDEYELYKRFGEIVLDIYSIADNVNSYEQLGKTVFKYSFIEKISKKYLNEADYEKIMLQYKNSVHYFNKEYNLIKDSEYNSFVGDFLKGSRGGFNDVFKALEFNYQYIDLIILKLIIENQNNNIGWFDSEEKNKLSSKNINPYGISIHFEMDLWSWEDEVKNLSLFIRQLFYAYIFVYFIIFLRKVKKFIENEELMCILNNIIKENNEICQVLLKFYPIYINFYKDIFEDKFTVNEIETLILASKNKEKFDSLIEFNYYENIINDFKVDKDFKKLIDSIDKNIFMKYYSINDFNIVNNEEYFYNELFNYIIAKIINYLDEDEILDIIFSKVIYIDRLKKNDELREILKSKNKYLYDIKEEKKINKLDISDVNSGNDFERFLKEVFVRLGYHVALTPQTRDQGADLIIEKELVKIVVQAKFYESTVGNKAVQEIIAAKSYYDADSCMVVTNNTFTSSAYELAKANRVKLVDGNELNSMIEIANLFLE